LRAEQSVASLLNVQASSLRSCSFCSLRRARHTRLHAEVGERAAHLPIAAPAQYAHQRREEGGRERREGEEGEMEKRARERSRRWEAEGEGYGAAQMTDARPANIPHPSSRGFGLQFHCRSRERQAASEPGSGGHPGSSTGSSRGAAGRAACTACPHVHTTWSADSRSHRCRTQRRSLCRS
jgi:hypothetical protein